MEKAPLGFRIYKIFQIFKRFTEECIGSLKSVKSHRLLIYLAFISHAFQTPYSICMKGQLPAKAPAYIANAILEQSVGLISISFRPNNTLTSLVVYIHMKPAV